VWSLTTEWWKSNDRGNGFETQSNKKEMCKIKFKWKTLSQLYYRTVWNEVKNSLPRPKHFINFQHFFVSIHSCWRFSKMWSERNENLSKCIAFKSLERGSFVHKWENLCCTGSTSQEALLLVLLRNVIMLGSMSWENAVFWISK
jgi:hypothetical protein